jgi:DNA gyrase/topoisomerase IV subunit A
MSLRLSVLEAYVLAAERREELIEAVAEAADPEEARRSVARLLGITEDEASGVLDLRVSRFSRSEVAQHRSEADHLRNRLEQGR